MAASLLPSGATAVGFGGYVGSSRVDSSLASTPDAAPVSVSFYCWKYEKLNLITKYLVWILRAIQDIDGDLALHLKRLSRKDPTTKVNCNAAGNLSLLWIYLTQFCAPWRSWCCADYGFVVSAICVNGVSSLRSVIAGHKINFSAGS